MSQISKLKDIVSHLSEQFECYHISVKLKDGTTITKVIDRDWSHGVCIRWLTTIDAEDRVHAEIQAEEDYGRRD